MQTVPDLENDSWLRNLRADDEVFWRDPAGARSGICTLESIIGGTITSPYTIVNLRTAELDLVETFAHELETHKPGDKPGVTPVKAESVGFLVTLNVADHGEYDPATVRDALIDGIRRAEDEGNLTRLGDETTRIELVSVRQVINESAMLQFVQQIARLSLSSETGPHTTGIGEWEGNHDALMGLIRQARQLVDPPAPESPPRRGPKP
jgi:hypothetical protein